MRSNVSSILVTMATSSGCSSDNSCKACLEAKHSFMWFSASCTRLSAGLVSTKMLDSASNRNSTLCNVFVSSVSTALPNIGVASSDALPSFDEGEAEPPSSGKGASPSLSGVASVSFFRVMEDNMPCFADAAFSAKAPFMPVSLLPIAAAVVPPIRRSLPSLVAPASPTESPEVVLLGGCFALGFASSTSSSDSMRLSEAAACMSRQ
mmetsp:Transcript_64405/g.153622  ORF Transcript_64405/g.153622 Transcript_64405/m.153622 type:complete len:207 (-) Transcript_64405:2671-3291(-)